VLRIIINVSARVCRVSARVAMDVNDYKNRMIEIFSDSNTYSVIKKDPIKKLSNDLRNVLSR